MPRSSININFDGSARGLVRAAREASRGLARTDDDLRRTRNAFNRTAIASRGLTSSFRNLAAVAGVGLGFAGLVALGRSAAQSGQALILLSQQLNEATDTLQAMQLAARLAGVNADTFNNSVRQMRFAVGEAVQGVGEYERIFRRLGISMEELPFLSTIQLMQRVAAEVDNLELAGTAEGTSILRRLGGESGGLEALLGQGGDRFNELFSRAAEAPRTSEDQLQSLGALNAELELLGNNFRVLRDSVVSGLEPAISGFIGALSNGLGFFADLFGADSGDIDAGSVAGGVGIGGDSDAAEASRLRAEHIRSAELSLNLQTIELQRQLALEGASNREKVEANLRAQLQSQLLRDLVTAQIAYNTAEREGNEEAILAASAQVRQRRAQLTSIDDIVAANSNLLDGVAELQDRLDTVANVLAPSAELAVQESLRGLQVAPSRGEIDAVSEAFEADRRAANLEAIRAVGDLALAPSQEELDGIDRYLVTRRRAQTLAVTESLRGLQIAPQPSEIEAVSEAFEADRRAANLAAIRAIGGLRLGPTQEELDGIDAYVAARRRAQAVAVTESIRGLQLAPQQSEIDAITDAFEADRRAANLAAVSAIGDLQLAPSQEEVEQTARSVASAIAIARRRLIVSVGASIQGLAFGPSTDDIEQANQEFLQRLTRLSSPGDLGLQLGPTAAEIGTERGASDNRQRDARVEELEATQAAQQAIQALNDEQDRTIDQLLIQIRLREEEQVVGSQARRAHRAQTLQIHDAQRLTARLTSRQINLENQLEIARASGNREQIRAIELQKAATQRELDNIDTLIASRADYYDRVARLQLELEQEQNRSLKRIAEALDDTLNAGLRDALSGTDNLKRAFEELAVSIAEAAIEFAFFGSNGQTPGRSLGNQIVEGLVGNVFDEGFSGIFNSDIPSAEVGTTAAQGGLPGGGGANYVQNFYINNSDEATVRRGLNNALPAIQDATAGRVAQDLTRPSTIRQSATGG